MHEALADYKSIDFCSVLLWQCPQLRYRCYCRLGIEGSESESPVPEERLQIQQCGEMGVSGVPVDMRSTR